MFVKNLVKILSVRIPKQQFAQLIKTQLNNTNTKRKLFSAFTLAGLGIGYLSYQNSTVQLAEQFYEKQIPADFQEGEKRAVQVGPEEDDCVLVVKYEGKYYCLSNSCPHFGFDLVKGPLFEDKITCPLHMAQFNIKTGLHEYGPIVNGLETFDIQEKDGHLHIKVPKSKLNVPKSFTMGKKGNDKRHFVIIGAGVAGLTCAETLRQAGFQGEITMISKENELPYDRTLLSKNPFGADINKIALRDKNFLESHDINIVNNTEITSINYDNKVIQTSKGKEFKFEKLLIATGGTPRVPQIASQQRSHNNVHVLRNWEDLVNLRQNAENAKNIVIIGASFIGLETASSLKSFLKDKAKVTVCDFVKVPFEKVLGEQIGSSLKSLHEENGIEFKLNNNLKQIINGSNGKVEKVELSSGEKINADLVLLATGIFFTPSTKFAGKLQLTDNGSICTDVFLRTSEKDVYAAGDVATYPYWPTGENVRIEHYVEAMYQGYVSALNMMDRKVPMNTVPFFWTRFWNKSLQYSGHAAQYDDIYIDGDVKKQDFLAYYFWNGNVVAAAAMGRIPHITVINEAMKLNVMPKAADIKAGKVTFDDIMKRVQSNRKQCACKRAQQLNNN